MDLPVWTACWPTTIAAGLRPAWLACLRQACWPTARDRYQDGQGENMMLSLQPAGYALHSLGGHKTGIGVNVLHVKLLFLFPRFFLIVWMTLNIYSRLQYDTVSHKNAPWCLIITLANVNRFSKFFHHLIRKKILLVGYISQMFPPYLQCYTCEFRKSKNVTDFDIIFNKLSICSWCHFEDLI